MKTQRIKIFRVHYLSRYFPEKGIRTRLVNALSPKDIRNNWHGIIGTDEYAIKKIEEVL